MRTRIALVAITSIAVITSTFLTQAVNMQPARASTRSAQKSTPATAVRRTDRLTSLVSPAAPTTTTTTLPDLLLGAALLNGHLIGITVSTPVVPPHPVVVDTVTPAQRAAWERVAVCEEGGNWQSDGPRFSGGLGITRANWANYGGLQYASEGALATPDQQIMVAERIQSTAPDQYGCRGW